MENQKKHQYLYWEDSSIKGGIFKTALRQGDWKIVRKYEKGTGLTSELFNLRDDIGEERDIASEHKEIVERLEKLMTDAHRQPE